MGYVIIIAIILIIAAIQSFRKGDGDQNKKEIEDRRTGIKIVLWIVGIIFVIFLFLKDESKPSNYNTNIYKPQSVPIINRDSEESDYQGGCCKICRQGKACGDSCINVNYTCHKGAGCACDE